MTILVAHRMIVTYTIHPDITARCGDRVWAIDVGMSRLYGGRVRATRFNTSDSRPPARA